MCVDFGAKGREALEMHSEHMRRFVDGEGLGCIDQGFALFALVAIAATKVVGLGEEVEHRFEVGRVVGELEREVEEGVKGVGIVAAARAVHARTEAAAKETMDECRLLELGVGLELVGRPLSKAGCLEAVHEKAQELVRVLLPAHSEVWGDFCTQQTFV